MKKEPDIEQLKEGNEGAFRDMVKMFQHRVVNTAFGYVHNKQDAEDIAQEVFLYVYKSVAGFREKSSISTWIYRITINKSLDFIKSKQRQKRGSGNNTLDIEDLQISHNPQESPENLLLQKESLANIYAAIELLPNKMKTAIVLTKQEGLSTKETAEVMKTSTSAVESLIHRGKKEIAAYLNRSDL